MKNRTKEKIIRFVKRIIDYREPIQVPLDHETVKIQKIKLRHLCYEYEASHLDILEKHVAMALAEEMVKQKAFVFNVIHDYNHYYIANAILTWIPTKEEELPDTVLPNQVLK